MTSTAGLVEVIHDIVTLLRECDRGTYASWLATRQAILTDPGSIDDERRRQVIAELHGVVAGMGGLADLTLRPPQDSLLSPVQARQLLDDLQERLYVLTRQT
ncbi:hypothetical protein [Rathayibacter soli]|uniref:hypothetical protein n=1 Tax=Rathayibacter soli TaxID=3144168 RepID=UPI0027E55591|nr:hypothetical protein [Glaciibacter superstes]